MQTIFSPAALIIALLSIGILATACDETTDESTSEDAQEAAVAMQAEEEPIAEDEDEDVEEGMMDTEHVDLELEGMTCVSCAANIESSLEETDGVASVEVDFGNQLASVEYDASEIDPDGLVAVVEEAGFEAQIVQ